MALRIFKYISDCQVYSTDCFIDKYNFIQKLYKLCINKSSATLVERQEESETQSPTRTPCLLRTQSETMSRKTGNRMELWRENRSVREACSGQRLVNLLVTLRYKINTQLSMSKRRQWKWELRGEPEAKTIIWKHCWHPSERHYCQKKCTKRRQMGKDQVLGNAAIQVAGSRKGTESRTGRE